MVAGEVLIRWVAWFGMVWSLAASDLVQNGSWNGGVKDILDGVADVGGAFFTASYIRTTVVDFTLPLLEITNTFFLKNTKAANSWTSFIKPFNMSIVHLLPVIMIIICTLSLAILAHLSKEKNIKEFGFEKSFIYSFGAYCALSARRYVEVEVVYVCYIFSSDAASPQSTLQGG